MINSERSNTSDNTRNTALFCKTIGLALFLGLTSGFAASAYITQSVFCLMGIFGGAGLLLYHFRGDTLLVHCLLPLIHSIYAHLIIRFRLRGILFVMMLHYLSGIFMLTMYAIWIERELFWLNIAAISECIANIHLWTILIGEAANNLLQ